MDKPLGVVLVGYGYWSPKLIRNIRNLSEFKLIAVCEKDLTRHAHIKEEQPDTEVLQHYRDAFARDDVDAVVIATIPSSHYRIAKAALLAGKHVLVEKPLTLSADEGEELLEEAQRQRVTLMVDHTFLYSPAIEKMVSIVKSGELGALHSIESTRVNLGLFQRDTNVIWDLAPHDFSILLSLVPQLPTHVSAIGSKTVVHPAQKSAQESIAHITLYYESGLTAHIHVSWISPTKVRQLTVIGSDSALMYDQLAADQLMLRKQGVYPSENGGESGPLFTYKMEEAMPVTYEKEGEDLLRMLSDFAGSIIDRREPVSSAALGLSVVRLLQAAELSLRNDGKRTAISWGKTSPVQRMLMQLKGKYSRLSSIF
jgi:predicted dehydrogenase